MEFEWDENKNLENIKNHGISFEEAVKAFDDDLSVPLEEWLRKSWTKNSTK